MMAKAMPFAKPRLSGYQRVHTASERLYATPSHTPTRMPKVTYSTGMLLAKPVRNQPRPKPTPAMVMIVLADQRRCSQPPMGPETPMRAITRV